MAGNNLSADVVRGWSNVALDLNAVDHAIGDPAAPGPCASSYALGLAYAAMADSCAFATGAYEPAVATCPPGADVSDPELFVGGAVFGFLNAIFVSPDHQRILQEALSGLPNGGADWDTGLGFSTQFAELWRSGSIMDRINPLSNYYQLRPGKHKEDPLNPGQGFYGQAWAGQTASVDIPDDQDLRRSITPLGLSLQQLDQAYRPLTSPPEEASEEFLNSAREAKVYGELPDDIGSGPLGPHLTIGTFWAYDGAPNIGTPPRLYTQLVLQIIEGTATSDDGPELARLLALCNIAMANASIVAWRGKYEHAIARPVCWIRDAETEIRDDKWEPLGSPRSRRDSPRPPEPRATQAAFLGATLDPDKFTPNFPAYPSGHATFGGACFKVLELFVGTSKLAGENDIDLSSDELDDGTVDPFTEDGRSSQRVSFRTTEDLIDANAFSRILLGVHWDFDGTDGSETGKILAELVTANLYLPQQEQEQQQQQKQRSRPEFA